MISKLISPFLLHFKRLVGLGWFYLKVCNFGDDALSIPCPIIHAPQTLISVILPSLFPHTSDDSSHVLFPPDLISHLLDSVVDPLTEEVRQLKYEQIVVPESYSGPRLSFPLSVTDTNALLSAFKEEQVQHYKTFTNSLNDYEPSGKNQDHLVHYLSLSSRL